MIPDIKVTSPAKPAVDTPKVQASAGSNSAKPLDASVRKADLVPIKKADLAVDPIEMQQKLKKSWKKPTNIWPIPRFSWVFL